MKEKLFGLSLGFAALLMATDIASAQNANRCAQRDVVVGKLNSDYGESRKTMGMTANNGIIEMYASEETGSWTITVTHPNGMTCLLAAGTSFEQVQEELPAALGAPA